MKKGYVCQKDNLIKNLTYFYFKNYPNNTSFIFSIITTIMEDIELYEKSSQMLFCESIGKLAEKFSEKRKDDKLDHLNELFLILKHFLIGISTLEKSISDEYVINFNNLINTFCNNNFKIVINNELIEYTISLGKFGQSIVNKKFSVFFCVSLIRISKNKIDNLYDRVLFLGEDTERVVKFEMAYHIRFLIKLNDSKFCQEKMTNFLSYYLEDIDMNFLLITFQSLLYEDNLSKFESHPNFMNCFNNKVNEIISCTDFYTLSYDFHNISEIFLCILNYSYNNKNSNKDLIQAIKIYIKNFFNVRELKISTNVSVSFKIDYCLNNFDKICYVFLKEKEIQFLNEILQIAMTYFFETKENIDILYEKLYLIILNLPNEFLNKAFFNKILFFIDDDNNNGNNTPTHNNPTLTITDVNSNSNINKDNNSNTGITQNNIMNYKKEYKEIWLNNFDLIMIRMIRIDNDKFIKCLLSKFNNFLELIKKIKEWRMTIKLFKGLQLIPKFIMLNYKKFPNYEDYLQILYNFSKDLLTNEINILIEKEITQLLAEIIHFSIFRKEILEYLKINFLFNKSFYRRRVYALFGDSAFSVFSKEYIIQYKIYSNLFETAFVNDIPLMQNYIIQILIKYEIIDQDLINKVKNILNTQSKNDILLNLNLKKYLALSQNKNKRNSTILEIEKIQLEKKIKEIEKLFNIKEKKEEPLFKKSVKSKIKSSNLGNTKKGGAKIIPSKIFQKIDDNKNQGLLLRKSSMNNNNQENKINEYFHNNGNVQNIHNNSVSSNNVPKIKKNITKNGNNILSKSVNFTKNNNNNNNNNNNGNNNNKKV